MIGESWLRNSIPDSEINLDGFNTHRIDRVLCEGGKKKEGGVLVYSRSGLSVTVLESISITECFEYISLRVTIGPSSIIVVGVYRPPSATKDSIDRLFDLIYKYANEELIVTGDLNLNWLNDSSNYIKEKCNQFDPLALHQLIINTTRPNLKVPEKSTLIDIILTNRPEKMVASGVFALGNSDHCPIACIRSTQMETTKPCLIHKRNIK